MDISGKKRRQEWADLGTINAYRQNVLIDDFLNSHEEEARDAQDQADNGWKVRVAVNASSLVNFCLFIIQLYAAISTGSLALFATAADAFVCITIPHTAERSMEGNSQVDGCTHCRWTLFHPQ